MSEPRRLSQSYSSAAPAHSTTTQAWYQEGQTALQDLPSQKLSVSTAAIQTALSDLQELVGMLPNWDSYGGDSPTQEAIAAASDLLHTVHRTLGRYVGGHTAPAYVAPRADGGVQLEWGARPLKVSAHTTAEGKFGYLLVDWRSGTRHSEEMHEVSQSAVLQAIARVVFEVPGA